ncbi:DUF6404 family protein [Microbulbifer sp. SAOS-129_SWC]|uniref:DUF6404 family protein n=1 Tax=Microbulbifer sp. SAOS-129_SWC TaxID=3145235 RepID=UPI00321652F5
MNSLEKYKKAADFLVKNGIEKKSLVPRYVRFLANLGFEVKHPAYASISYNHLRYLLQLFLPFSAGIGISLLLGRSVDYKIWVGAVIILPLVFSLYDWSRASDKNLPRWDDL